jgi:hypothetical protein
MPETLYLSSRELTTIINALELCAAEPDQLPPTVLTGADRAFAAILAGYARRVASKRSDDTDTYDADRLRDQWYAHLRPDLTNPPAKTEARP